MLISFIYLNLFTSNDHTEDYHIRNPNDESFVFEIEDKEHIYVGQNSASFETSDKIVE